MNTWERIRRHARLTALNYSPGNPTPPFLILFINSICNQTCEHCFYWRSLNQKDDLTFEELERLSLELGTVENLNLSGGEPFLRKEFAEICTLFIRNNGTEQIYVPTNGSFKDRTVAAVEKVLQNDSLRYFVVEFSLDGMPEYHNRFRGMKDAFDRAMDTYDALVELQRRDARLRIHAISTATSENIGEIRQLTRYLFERCPAMDHHNLALIRGDRKNPTLQGPGLARYYELYDLVKSTWAAREAVRYGAIMEPLLQWAKVKTAEEQRQVIPCRAGRMTGVVYANGDVSLCENHPPIGNLRVDTFQQIWANASAASLRQRVAEKECYCTNEVFLWPSINYQPVQLVRSIAAARPWRAPKAPPTDPPERRDADPPKLRVLS